jgi:hypothetical protein
MTCKQVNDLLVESLYGELDEARVRELDAHLAGCAACATLHEEMRSTVATMHERRRPDPGDEYFDEFYARLEDRMAREGSVVDGARVAARRRSNVSWGYRVAAAVAVLAAGVWIGRATMAPGPQPGSQTIARNEAPADSSPRVIEPANKDDQIARSEPAQPGPIDGTPPAGREPQPGPGNTAQVVSADARAREYIERSQVLLLALVNASPDSSDTAQGFDQQRERASMLVREASSLREDLPGSDNRRLRELVTSLQLILREIANLENQSDLDAVKIIRNRVDREGVLLQIDVEQMRDDDKAKAEPERGGAID